MTHWHNVVVLKKTLQPYVLEHVVKGLVMISLIVYMCVCVDHVFYVTVTWILN